MDHYVVVHAGRALDQEYVLSIEATHAEPNSMAREMLASPHHLRSISNTIASCSQL